MVPWHVLYSAFEGLQSPVCHYDHVESFDVFGVDHEATFSSYGAEASGTSGIDHEARTTSYEAEVSRHGLDHHRLESGFGKVDSSRHADRDLCRLPPSSADDFGGSWHKSLQTLATSTPLFSQVDSLGTFQHWSISIYTYIYSDRYLYLISISIYISE